MYIYTNKMIQINMRTFKHYHITSNHSLNTQFWKPLLVCPTVHVYCLPWWGLLPGTALCPAVTFEWPRPLDFLSHTHSPACQQNKETNVMYNLLTDYSSKSKIPEYMGING